MIDPRIFNQETDTRGWNGKFPIWGSTIYEISTGCYYVPKHYQSIALIKNQDNSVRNINNICTHKQSIILSDSGKLNDTIVCPIHHWSWDKNGEIKSSHGIKSCSKMNLKSLPQLEWNDHIFIGNQNWIKDLSKINELIPYMNISNYEKYSHHEIEYNFDWKIFYEIFLDLYHVQSFHPGLRSLTNHKTFDWIFGDQWSCQTALFKKDDPSDENYAELYRVYKSSGYYNSSKYGAIWLGIYPNIMLEYYPGCFVASTVWPNGKGKCINYLDFYYDKTLLKMYPEFPEIQFKCFMATADEDEIIGDRISKGRAMLSDPIKFINHPHEEKGTEHFYNWLSTSYML